MLTYEQALHMVAKEIEKILKEATEDLTSAEVLFELATRIPTMTWSGYETNIPYLSNLRRLSDRILRGDGLSYLREFRKESSENLNDGGNDDVHVIPRDPWTGIIWKYPNLARKEKLRRQMEVV